MKGAFYIGTGDISTVHVIAGEKFRIQRSTGGVRSGSCDAAQIHMETDTGSDTGSVKGSLRSEKVFMAQSDTGSIEVPKTTGGGKRGNITDTGNVRMEIE